MQFRRLVLRAALVLVALIVAPIIVDVVAPFFVAWARSSGLYEHPSERIANMMRLVGTLIANPWFHWIGGGILGFAAGLWVDSALRQYEATSAKGTRNGIADQQPAVSFVSPNTMADALDIQYADGEAHNRLELYKNGSARRTVLLKLRNSGNGFLSDCMVYLKKSSPVLREVSVILLPPTRLLVGEYKFFPLATFFEKPLPSSPANNLVTICEHYGGGWAAAPVTIDAPSVSVNEPLLLTVEALASECATKEAHFRLWVEQPSRRLRLEKA